MKKYLLLTILLALAANCFAQQYNESEKNALQNIIRKDFKAGSSSVISRLGLLPTDTLTWATSEEWIPKVMGLEWNNASPKRLTKIDWGKYDETVKQKGKLDFSPFPELIFLSINAGYVSSFVEIDITQNPKLTYFQGTAIDFKDYLFENNTNIESLIIRMSNVKRENDAISFPSLSKLKYIGMSSISSPKIDLTHNPLLEYFVSFEINHANGVTLDLSNCSSLKNVNMSGVYRPLNISFPVNGTLKLLSFDQLYESSQNIDVSALKSIEKFKAAFSSISSLTTGNTQIDSLSFIITSAAKNKINYASIKGLKSLEISQCNSDRSQWDLDLSGCQTLQYLDCSSNNLTSLTVGNNPNLKTLLCKYNRLSSLDVSGCPNLFKLDCGMEYEEVVQWMNVIEELNLSNNTKLEYLDCAFNKIEKLNLDKNPKLSYLNCSNNKIDELTLHQDAEFELLDFSNNNLPALSSLPLNKANKLKCTQLKVVSYDFDLTKSDILDLGSEYILDGHLTNFHWDAYDWVGNTQPAIPTSLGNGRFKIDQSAVNIYYELTMTNAHFPNFVYAHAFTTRNNTGIETDQTNNSNVSLENAIVNRGEPIYVLNESGQNGVIELYSIAGKLLSNNYVSGNKTEINAPATNGVYIVSVILNDGTKASFKIIVK